MATPAIVPSPAIISPEIISPAIIQIATWKSWQAANRPAQLVDVRSATEFASGHLPGAINIPLEQLELRTADLAATVPVVLVCQAGTRALLAAGLLQNSGKSLVVLEGGTSAWIKAGNPAVQSIASRWALERQVRLIAGLLVITGVVLAVTVSPWFLGLAAFIGCGLTFAGATNLCPMGEMLTRLPWNRIQVGTQSGTQICARCSSGTDSTANPGVTSSCDQQENA